jgi:hypothetical protein
MNTKGYLVGGTVIAGLLLLSLWTTEQMFLAIFPQHPTQWLKPVLPDTVYVSKAVPKVVVHEVQVPHEVKVYVRDTLYRERICDTTLVAGVELQSNRLTITKLDVDGQARQDIHHIRIMDYAHMSIDHAGRLEAKPKRMFWHKLGKALGTTAKVGGGILIGVFLGKAL